MPSKHSDKKSGDSQAATSATIDVKELVRLRRCDMKDTKRRDKVEQIVLYSV